MSKEKLNNLIDKVIGKVGPLRVPAYWMNKLFKDIVEWISATEGSIAEVGLKVDKTKASIPTKVSQLENDAEYAEKSFLPVSKISQSPYTGYFSLNDKDVVFAIDVLPEDFQYFGGINNGIGEATLFTFLDKKSSTKISGEATTGFGSWIVEAGHDFGLYKITIGNFGSNPGWGCVLIDKVKSKLGWAHATFVVGSDSEQLSLSVEDASSYYNGNLISGKNHSPGIGEHSYLIKFGTTDSNGNILLGTRFFGPKLKKLQLSDVSILNLSSLADMTYLEEVIFPESLSVIKRNAFNNSPALKELRFPGSIKTLEYQCFEGVACPIIFEDSCKFQEIGRFKNKETANVEFLKDVVFPEGCIIDEAAMRGAIVRGDIFISTDIPKPLNMDNQYYGAFEGCIAPRVFLSKDVTSIGERAFSKGKISELYIEDLYSWLSVTKRSAIYNDYITYRSEKVFIGGEEAVDIVIPDGITRIGSGAMMGIKSLRTVKSNGTIEEISTSPFQDCPNLLYIDFSNQKTIPSVTIYKTWGIIEVPHIVPDELYDEWIITTNWATIARYIIKKSDWDAQQVTE